VDLNRRTATTGMPGLLLIGLALAGPPAAHAQEAAPLSQPEDGPVVEGYGAVYGVPDPDFETPTATEYRVVFDVSVGADEPDVVNARINTLARFLNMHGQAGVDADAMHLALVLHGSAGKDALDHAGYRSRFGIDNPNLPLLERLAGAGVEIVLCGQTAMHRGLAREELAEPVQLALSAMTALATLQARGYALVGF